MGPFDAPPGRRSAAAADCEMRLYREVRNAGELREKLTSKPLRCAFVNPSLVWDPLHVRIAANGASSSGKSLVTRNVFTEILYRLSHTKNVSETLKTYGLSGSESDVLLVTLGPNAVADADEAGKEIVGDLVDLTDLERVRDAERIKKLHKIRTDDPERVADLLLSRAATKGIC